MTDALSRELRPRRRRRHRDAAPYVDAAPRECGVVGCVKGHYAKGYCRSHYNRQRMYGDAEYVPARPVRRGCSAEGCVGVHVAKGYCKPHYSRYRAYGDPEGGPMRRTGCSVEGCDGDHLARGLCKEHYHQHYNRQRGASYERQVMARARVMDVKLAALDDDGAGL